MTLTRRDYAKPLITENAGEHEEDHAERIGSKKQNAASRPLPADRDAVGILPPPRLLRTGIGRCRPRPWAAPRASNRS